MSIKDSVAGLMNLLGDPCFSEGDDITSIYTLPGKENACFLSVNRNLMRAVLVIADMLTDADTILGGTSLLAVKNGDNGLWKWSLQNENGARVQVADGLVSVFGVLVYIVNAPGESVILTPREISAVRHIARKRQDRSMMIIGKKDILFGIKNEKMTFLSLPVKELASAVNYNPA